MKPLLPLTLAFALALPALAQDDAPPKDKPAKKEPAKGDKKTDEKKEVEPVSPGAILPRNFGTADLKPATDTATVKTILPKFGGPQPELIVTEVTAEIIDEENAPEMQATFETKPKLSIDPMIEVMSMLPKSYKSKGWPKKKTVHFVIDEVLADSAPNNLAAAVLIDSMLSGTEIPENLVLFGGVAKGGAITRGGDKTRAEGSYLEAIKLASSAARPAPESDDDEEIDLGNLPDPDDLPKPDKTVILITGNLSDGTLDDLIIDENWDVLNSTIVLRCKSFLEATTIISDITNGGAIGQSITELAEAQKVLRDKSIRSLANDAIWKRVVTAGKAFEGNATAFAYARLKTRKVAETYSLDRCLDHINSTVTDVVRGGIDKFDDRALRKFVRDKTTAIKDLGRKIHPEATPVAAAGLIYIAELQDYAEAKKKAESKVKDRKDAEIPERAIQARNEAAGAYKEARSAALKKL